MYNIKRRHENQMGEVINAPIQNKQQGVKYGVNSKRNCTGDQQRVNKHE